MDDDKKSINKATMAQQQAIFDGLRANGVEVDGYWKWNEGWSDARLAKEIGVTEAAVTYRRSQLYGPLRPPRRIEVPAAVPAADDRIGVLEALVGELASRVETLRRDLDLLTRFNKQPPANGSHPNL